MLFTFPAQTPGYKECICFPESKESHIERRFSQHDQFQLDKIKPDVFLLRPINVSTKSPVLWQKQLLPSETFISACLRFTNVKSLWGASSLNRQQTHKHPFSGVNLRLAAAECPAVPIRGGRYSPRLSDFTRCSQWPTQCHLERFSPALRQEIHPVMSVMMQLWTRREFTV